MVMPIILEVMTHRMKIVLFEIPRLCIVVPISVVFNLSSTSRKSQLEESVQAYSEFITWVGQFTLFMPKLFRKIRPG